MKKLPLYHRWVVIGFIVAVLSTCFLTQTGCSTTRTPNGVSQAEDRLSAMLVGTYYNPDVHTKVVTRGTPVSVEMVDQHFIVTVDGTYGGYATVTDEIIRLIQLHTPEEDWGKLDPGVFYDRRWDQ